MENSSLEKRNSRSSHFSLPSHSIESTRDIGSKIGASEVHSNHDANVYAHGLDDVGREASELKTVWYQSPLHATILNSHQSGLNHPPVHQDSATALQSFHQSGCHLEDGPPFRVHLLHL